MIPSQDTHDESLNSERQMAEEILRLAAEQKLPSLEEIERAAKEALRKVLRVGSPSLAQTNRTFHGFLFSRRGLGKK